MGDGNSVCCSIVYKGSERGAGVFPGDCSISNSRQTERCEWTVKATTWVWREINIFHWLYIKHIHIYIYNWFVYVVFLLTRKITAAIDLKTWHVPHNIFCGLKTINRSISFFAKFLLCECVFLRTEKMVSSLWPKERESTNTCLSWREESRI